LPTTETHNWSSGICSADNAASSRILASSMLVAPHQSICMPISTCIPESAQSALAARKPETAAPLNSMTCGKADFEKWRVSVATKPSKASTVGFVG
jgi:hypothetical protein